MTTLATGYEPTETRSSEISSLMSYSRASTTPMSIETMSLSKVGTSARHEPIVVFIDREMPSAKWLNKTIVALAGLLCLPRDWTEDSQRIEPKTVKRMLEVLMTILEPDAASPAVVPTVEGGVQVEWHRNQVDFEIEVTPSGKLEFFFKGPKEAEREGSVENDLLALKEFTPYLKA